ncbi:MAG: BamA/TamA family outer membrane protein [Kofleriaceae bacterium]
MHRVVVLIALLAACGGAPARPARPKVKGVEYLSALKLESAGGVNPIADDDILPRLGLESVAKRQGSIDEYQLQLDTQRIVGAYQRIGYLGVDVKTRFVKQPGHDAVTLVFVVTPGKRATTHIELFGLPGDVPFKKVLEAIDIKEGSPFDYDRYDAAHDPLTELFQDSGYAHARVEGTVIADRAKAQATVRWVIDPGPRCTFGEVKLVGVEDGLLADAVRERIGFVAGQKYSHRALADTQKAIYSIGLFGSVRVDPADDTIAAEVPVKVSVTPVTKNELSLGGGFGLDPSTYYVRGRLTWTRHGVITPLTTSALDLRPEYAFEEDTCKTLYYPWSCKSDFRGRVSETIMQQDLFLPNLRGEVEAGVDYLVYEAYSKLGPHLRLGLSEPIFTKLLQIRIGWLYQIDDFPQIYVADDTAQRLGIDHINYIGAYTGSLILDLRDSPINTTYGLYAEARVSMGTKFALGDYNYFELTPEVRGYLPLAPHYVVAGRVRFGTITGQVPATERYFGGGTSSMRGFGARALSPFAPSRADPTQELPIGGAGLFEASIELRTPFVKVKGLQLTDVLFLDGGDVTFAASEIDPTYLHWAAGLGVRAGTPIGPFGLDIAYRLNRTDDNGVNPGPAHTVFQHMKFSVAFGEAF